MITYKFTGRIAKSKANRCAATAFYAGIVSMRREPSVYGGWIYFVDVAAR